MTAFEIEMVADFVCAWCYIGKRSLERGINLYQRTYPGGRCDTFHVKWSPYYLDYHTGADSIDKAELAVSKLAHMSRQQQSSLQRRMEQIGSSVGISFRWGGRVGTTRDAHRLIRIIEAEASDMREAMINKLLEAYHERELDISSVQVLGQLAEEVGAATPGQVRQWLQSAREGDEVDQMARLNKGRMAGAGVPTFIFPDGKKISGSPDVSEVVEVLVDIKALPE